MGYHRLQLDCPWSIDPALCCGDEAKQRGALIMPTADRRNEGSGRRICRISVKATPTSRTARLAVAVELPRHGD